VMERDLGLFAHEATLHILSRYQLHPESAAVAV
jgi:hypothetical protein